MLHSLTTPAMVAIGLVLFLFGMRQLESGVRSFGYNTFKRWLTSSTASPAGSAFMGVTVTAILQSSSMVSLLVLAFASAGALPLYNAIGVLFGANLGTTVTGWMVATIGFKLSLNFFALPMMATGALMQLLSSRLKGLLGLGMLLFGLGLIIFGLNIMKEAVADLPGLVNLEALQGYGPGLYFLVGAGLAALIQSSSATMMITLAALHAGVLDLSAAAALVIGADLGTTSTTVLGSIGGHCVKRQLALAHFLFNALVDLAAFFLLLPLLPQVMNFFALQDPLYSLVAFHSLFNLLGLLLFLPFLKPFSRWIGRRFLSGADLERPLVGQPITVPDAALVAIDRVLVEMRLSAVVLGMHGFHLQPEQLQLSGALQSELDESFERRINAEQRYLRIKQQESDLLAFSFDLQAQALTTEQVTRLERQTRESRALVYSSKTLKDIREDLVYMRHSPQPEVLALYKEHRNFIKTFYRHYLQLSGAAAASAAKRDANEQLLRDIENHYTNANRAVHAMASGDVVGGAELSTMLNVNREIHHSCKSLLLQ
ncbi:MAG: Na/Pi symporter [Halieaceae bacterium]|jgi:phosphate:Na+ symporter|nr:Na/Pi symporter [Halieaceae bacterium]